MKYTRLLLAALAAWAWAGTLLAGPAPPGSKLRTTTSTLKGLPNVNYQAQAQQKLSLEHLPVDGDGQRVVARVNGRRITERQLTNALRLSERSQRAMLAPPQIDAMRKPMAQVILDDLIVEELAIQYAEQNGFEITESDIDRHLAALNEGLRPGDRYGDLAVKRNMSRQEMRREIKGKVAMRKLQTHLASRVDMTSVSDEQLLDFLRKNQTTTSKTTELRASHIVVRALETDSTETIERARATAQRVLDRIRSGMDFAEAARRYSQDKTTFDKGGDLGYFSRGRMYPTFDDAAFALEPGQTSALVRTPVGFHIIRVTQKYPVNVHETYTYIQSHEAMIRWREQTLRSAKIERYLQ